MKRIIIHHTAGAYKPNSTDLKAYHFLVDNLGTVYSGVYKPEDNENCKDGKYAAHTYLGNTGSIGVSACCNYGFNLKHKQSLYPFTLKQFNTICKLCADLCKSIISMYQIFIHTTVLINPKVLNKENRYYVSTLETRFKSRPSSKLF